MGIWNWIHAHHEELQSLSPIAIILASVVAAGVAVTIGRLQYQIARSQRDIAQDKLKMDFFDRQYERRAAIYEATRTFLADVFDGEKISEASIKAYGLRILDAKFLFHDDPLLHKYLREIHQRVSQWYYAKNSEEAAKQLEWIMAQGEEYSGFDVRFIPFLVYKLDK